MVVLPGARELRPLRQGDLSRLCGFYAILNAVQLALYPEPLTAAEMRSLYAHAAEHLNRHKLLAKALYYGIDEPPWRTLMRAIVDEAAAARSMKMSVTPPIRPACRSRSRAIDAICRAVDGGSPVLVAFGGALDHYTVVCGLSETRLRLFDSLGLRAITKDAIGLGEGSWRRHWIDADSVFALHREE